MSAVFGESRGFGADLLASTVVFLVSLPLCMGIAIASGQPPTAGIVTGIVGGIVVGMLSGCPLQVPGPAAGLSVVVWEIGTRQGPGTLGLVVTIAGLIQLVAGALRLGQWFRAVPPAVIHGMLAGIGVLIFASQFHVMVDDKPHGSGLANLGRIPHAIHKGLVPTDSSSHHLAAGIGLVTLFVVAAWTIGPRAIRRVPAQLAAVAIATLVACAFALPIHYVEVPADLLGAIRFLPVESWARLTDPAIWMLGFAVAVIASAETLLSAGAVDRLHDGPRTKYDRELVAQGVGNTLCGLIGGLPMTGVIVRSKTNVDAGAHSRWSTVLHGVWLLLAVAVFPMVLRLVPVASLAGLLVYTGYKLIDTRHLRDLWRDSRADFAICVATIVGIVTTDLLKGVVLGLALSAARLLWAFSHLGVVLEHESGGTEVLRLDGVATFLLLPRLAASLEAIEPGRRLRVDATHLDYIDHACLELIEDWVKRSESEGGSVEIDHAELAAILHGHRRYGAG